jgi:signal transduction histidine kinase/ActR/RegA family two-component response regulator
MKRARKTSDALLLDAFVQEYKGFVPVRLTTVAAITATIAVFASPIVAALYGFTGCLTYGALYQSLRRATQSLSPNRGIRLLRLTSGLAMSTMSFAVALVGLYLRFSTHYAVEAALLLIGMLVFGALQPHMSRISFVACVAWPMAALILIAAQIGLRDHDPVVFVGMMLFIVGVTSMTMRHSMSNRRLIFMRARLSGKNARLKDALMDAQQHRAEAEAASLAKSNFLAVTSHEIRTPLNAVLGLGEGLRREAITERQRELATGVVDAGAMLLRLLNAVLDLSQIEQGKMALRPTKVDLRQTLHAIAGLWRQRVEDRGLTLVLEQAGDARDFLVEVDLGKLEQTIINLVSNAVKFTEAGDIRLVARATPSADGLRSHLRVEVLDRGPGVDEADRERVFAPFEQTEGGRRAGGAGLGLAVSRAMIDMMGGKIGCRPRAGGGTCFWFELDLPLTAATSAETPLPATASSERGLHVLAAEDNPANREVLKVLLQSACASLTIVEDGAEAVAAATQRDFDLVLMDAHMPRMDGVEALRLLRDQERQSGVRRLIYMLTANVFDADVQRYLAAGADGVLKKPIELAELYACLQEAEQIAYAQTDGPLRAAQL